MTNLIAPRQSGPHVWRADDYTQDDEWIWCLAEPEIEELVAATEPYAHASEADLALLTSATFVLPTLGPRLRLLRRRLTHGRGFEVIRGLPLERFPDGWAAAAFAGVGAHLGSLRSQNSAKDRIGHVRDSGADSRDPATRIYQTNERQSFHTDSADVVALLCLSGAVSGGESLLVSVAAIYNEMLDRDPGLARALFDVVATDRRGEVPDGAEPFFSIPVLSWYRDALTVMYQRQYIESAPRHPGVPPISANMKTALDLFDEIANLPHMSLRMTLEVGDMQFVHNHSLLHDRTGYVDDPMSPRHLLRLWLSVPGDRELVFLHALPFDGRMWSESTAALGRETCTPNLFDLGDSIEAWASAVLDRAGSDELIVVGCSVGGSCALEIAAAAPEQVAAIVLIGAKAEVNPDPILRDEAIRLLETQGIEAAWRAYWLPLFAETTSAAIKDSSRSWAVDQDVGSVVNAVQAFHDRRDLSSFAASWRKPLIGISGEHDIAPSPTKLRQITRGPNREFHLVPDCGHYVNLEQPAVFDTLLADTIRLIVQS